MTMTGQETTSLRNAVADAFDNFIKAFSAFDANQINRFPFGDNWTPAQVVVHIILATDGLADGKTGNADRPIDEFLPRIRPWWEDLNQKFDSPKELKPDNAPKDKHQLLTELQRVREKDLAIIKSQDLRMLCLDFELPTIGYLTRFEWMWFIEMHLKRHTYQLKNMLKKLRAEEATVKRESR